MPCPFAAVWPRCVDPHWYRHGAMAAVDLTASQTGRPRQGRRMKLIRFDLNVVGRGAKRLMTPIVVTSMAPFFQIAAAPDWSRRATYCSP